MSWIAGVDAAQRATEFHEINPALMSWKTESAKYKDRQAADRRQVWEECLQWNDSQLGALQSRVASVTQAGEQDWQALLRIVDEHVEVMEDGGHQ